MFFNNGNLKTIVFPLIFLDFYEKSQKTFRKYNGFVLPDAKNTNICIGYFWISIKIQKKNNGNPKIQKSKTLKRISVIFGFLDFAENPKIQKPKNPKITEILLKVLDFWIFGFF